jgi:hypothetical protein
MISPFRQPVADAWGTGCAAEGNEEDKGPRSFGMTKPMRAGYISQTNVLNGYRSQFVMY